MHIAKAKRIYEIHYLQKCHIFIAHLKVKSIIENEGVFFIQKCFSVRFWHNYFSGPSFYLYFNFHNLSTALIFCKIDHRIIIWMKLTKEFHNHLLFLLNRNSWRILLSCLLTNTNFCCLQKQMALEFFQRILIGKIDDFLISIYHPATLNSVAGLGCNDETPSWQM